MSEDEEIKQSVERNGWHAISVDDADPPFLYTIGLPYTFDHPEVIVLGLSPAGAYGLVGGLVLNVRDGRSYARPGRYSDLLDGMEVLVRPVHATQVVHWFGFAMGFYRLVQRPTDLTAIQLFWPDERGRLPDVTDCDPLVAAAQQRLELPRV